MPETNGLTAIKELFSFAFRDPKWKNKFLIGSGITIAGFFVPIVPWLLLLGYGARVARLAAAGQVVRRGEVSPPETGNAVVPAPVGDSPTAAPAEGSAAESAPVSGEGEAAIPPPPALVETKTAPEIRLPLLPEWDDWNGLFMDGLRQMGVSFLVSLPLVGLYGFGFLVYFGSVFGMALNENDPRAQALFASFFLVGIGIFFLCMLLAMIVLPFTYLFLPAAAAHVAVTRSFRSFFRVGEWFQNLRAHLGEYLALLFCLAGLYAVVMLVFYLAYFTFFLCCLWPFLAAPLGFYTTVLFFHLSGLAYRGPNVRLGL